MEIKVMSSGSAEPGLDFVAAAFQKETGCLVHITYNADVEGFDVLVASSDALKRKTFRPAGLVEDGAVVIGRMGIGVAVRPGAKLPDISSAATLQQAVLEADGIILTENHSSGIYIESVFRKMGIHEQVEAKISRLFNGPAAMDRILSGSGKEFTFLSINEIRTYKDKGLVLVGPLPDGVQLYRDFVAVAAASSPQKELARQFTRFCGGPGRPLLAKHGFS